MLVTYTLEAGAGLFVGEDETWVVDAWINGQQADIIAHHGRRMLSIHVKPGTYAYYGSNSKAR
jgi:hypothetical protein